MKKPVQKLHLHRETLLHLANAAGPFTLPPTITRQIECVQSEAYTICCPPTQDPFACL